MAKYEAHITMPRDQSELVEKGAVEPWVYSQIDGDPIMGKRAYCYLTAYNTSALRLLQSMTMMCGALEVQGVEILRRKVEINPE